MSYFGNSGPSQDGGFIAGIGAGAARLGNQEPPELDMQSLWELWRWLSLIFFESEQGYSRESDATLKEVAPPYYQSSENYYYSRNDPNVPQNQKDQANNSTSKIVI